MKTFLWLSLSVKGEGVFFRVPSVFCPAVCVVYGWLIAATTMVVVVVVVYEGVLDDREYEYCSHRITRRSLC